MKLPQVKGVGGGSLGDFRRGYSTTTELIKNGFCRPHSHLVAEVAQAAVTLRGSVELCDLRDVEAVHELLPYGLTQAVAQCHAHPVLSLRVANRLVQQVPADLANVLHNLEEDGAGRQCLERTCIRTT